MIATRISAKSLIKMKGIPQNIHKLGGFHFNNIIRHGSSSSDLLKTNKHLNEKHVQAAQEYELHAHKAADHLGRQQNHIWDREEINERLTTLYQHKPQTLSDKFMNGFVSS